MAIDCNNCIMEDSRQLSDAELVQLTVGGNSGAFDLLVLRHRAGVLYAARAAVRDWEQAEDVAQQALVEAYKCLHGLRDGMSFRAWLMTITRRCASRYRACEASQPDSVELSEAVIYSVPGPELFPGINDITERVRTSVSELSARSRQVVTLHYLDGYSCKEIAGRLGVPAGTVKRILHESRNNLRSKMGITKGDLRRMEVTDEVKQTKKGPRRLVWWVNGDWPGPMLSGLLAQSICLCINKVPKTIAQIAKQVDANPAFVQAAIEPLVREELVTKAGSKYFTSFIALDAEDWIEVTRETRAHAAKLADEMEKHLPALKRAWETTKFPEQGFVWPDMMWTVLAILVGNRGVARFSPRSAPGPIHAGSGKPYWSGGREEVSDEHVMWCSGLNISGSSNMSPFFWYAYFWSYGLDRDQADWNEERSRVWAAIAWGSADIESIAEAAGLAVGRTREFVGRGIETGLIRRDGDALGLSFPVFGPCEDELLRPTVNAVSLRICRKILDPATSDVKVMLERLGYGHLEEQIAPWRGWLDGNIIGESLRELLRRGVLPDPGKCAPANFAMYGWTAWVPLVTADPE